MAHGIDNSLAERAIAPLVSFAGGALDFDSVLSSGLEAGYYTELVVLDGWNGTPDDDEVLTSFIGSSGVAPDSNPPRWDGSDTWIPNGRGYVDYPHYPSYVSGGVLVADTRSGGQDTSNIDLSVGGQTFTFSARFMVRVGRLAPDHLTLVTAGVWALSEAVSQVPVIAGFLANGNMGVQDVLDGNLPGLLSGAADISLTGGATPGSPCAAISFGFVAEADRAIIGAPSPSP